MSRPLRPEEEWARSLMENALGTSVVQHDDGSQPGMFDFAIMYADQPPAAAEAVAAADAASIELWNLMNSGGRWQDERIAGGWMVALDPLVARANRLRDELPALLGQLERHGITTIRPGRRYSQFDAIAEMLGIAEPTRVIPISLAASTPPGAADRADRRLCRRHRRRSRRVDR